MRWIFIALVASNVLYLAWQVSHRIAPDRQRGEYGQAYAVSLTAMQRGLRGESRASVDYGEPEAAALPSTSAATRGELCWMVGPFPEVITAKQVALRLEGEGVSGEIKSIDISGVDEYWLYKGPYASRALAVQALKNLQEMNIEALLISEGELSNAVSLGIYAERADAESALAQLLAKGVAVELGLFPSVVTQLWFVTRSGRTMEDMESFWRDLEVDFPGVERRQNRCEGIAKYASVQ